MPSELREIAVAGALLLGACSLPPLTTADLFGVDAAARDAPPLRDAEFHDGGHPLMDSSVHACKTHMVCTGNLSGTVVDGCTRKPLAAVVGIAGRRQCSFDDKGGYFFADVPAGVALTLAAGRHGYMSWSTSIDVAPAGTAAVEIVLLPAAPYTCSDPPPETACVCEGPGCET